MAQLQAAAERLSIVVADAASGRNPRAGSEGPGRGA
jgi:hypothetical protein